MADKSNQLLLDALARAVANPPGMALFGSRVSPGLFSATTPGKQAAKRGKDEGLFEVLRTEIKGRVSQEICAITDKGFTYLLDKTSVKYILETLIGALDHRQAQIAELAIGVRQLEDTIGSWKETVRKVCSDLNNSQPLSLPQPCRNGDHWKPAALTFLSIWETKRNSEDCPLPELYRQASLSLPGMSIGSFHDGLRQLYEDNKIYLHPWTGPLYDMPEPACALLIGHEIAYYASLRQVIES